MMMTGFCLAATTAAVDVSSTQAPHVDSSQCCPTEREVDRLLEVLATSAIGVSKCAKASDCAPGESQPSMHWRQVTRQPALAFGLLHNSVAFCVCANPVFGFEQLGPCAAMESAYLQHTWRTKTAAAHATFPVIRAGAAARTQTV